MKVARLLRVVSPWSGADAVRWFALLVVAHAVWAAGVLLPTTGDEFNDRITPVNLAVVGFIIAAYADVSWLVGGRARIVRRRRALLPDLTLAAPPSAPGQGEGQLVAGPHLDLFHRSTCALVRGTTWPAITREGALEELRRPCQVCSP